MVEKVTQQREAQERNAHFAAVIESSGNPDRQLFARRHHTQLESAAERLYGYGAHEAVGRHVTDVYMAHARRRQKSSLCARCRARHSRSKRRVCRGIPTRLLRRLRSPRFVPRMGRSPDYRRSPATSAIRKRAEAALAQSMAQLNSLLTNAPIGFAFFNREHKFVRVNEYFSRLDGLPVEAHLDRGSRTCCRATRRFLRPFSIRFRYPKGDYGCRAFGEKSGEPGSERQWLIGIILVMNAQEQCEFAGAVVLDITERKQREDHIHYLLRELICAPLQKIMAIVQAMARQTVAEASIGSRFRGEIFQPACRVFPAHSHDLLLKENWQGVAIDELVESQLGAFAELIGSRIEIKGPNLLLTPEATQNWASRCTRAPH